MQMANDVTKNSHHFLRKHFYTRAFVDYYDVYKKKNEPIILLTQG